MKIHALVLSKKILDRCYLKKGIHNAHTILVNVFKEKDYSFSTLSPTHVIYIVTMSKKNLK